MGAAGSTCTWVNPAAEAHGLMAAQAAPTPAPRQEQGRMLHLPHALNAELEAPARARRREGTNNRPYFQMTRVSI